MNEPTGRQTSTGAICCGTATDTGKVRERNEDAYIVDAEVGLFGVVDGMGGHPGGDVAARIVSEDLPAMVRREFQAMTTRQPPSIRRWLGRLVVEQSRQLCFQGLGSAGFEGMGATVAVVLCLDDRAYMANLGDSRIYRLRRGRLVQLSRDHSVVSELLEQGQIDPEEALHHQARGLLTQYVGMPEQAEPHMRSGTLKPGDRFLLCTDGLTDMLYDAAIGELLEVNEEAQRAADALVEMANEAGGVDNTTVVVLDWQGG